MLYISTRRLFQRGDPGWDTYVDFVGLRGLTKVITIDPSLNEGVGGHGSFIGEFADIPSLMERLPKPTRPREFYLVTSAVGDAEPQRPDGFEPVGFDLSDETMTSSLLNCGPWQGELKPLADRLNAQGLLALADARRAKELLPRVWGANEPHANVTIWALFVAS